MISNIVFGATYVYAKELPNDCKGEYYRLWFEILDVPSYQKKYLVEALTGRDKGLWFTCTPANFMMRYALLKPVEKVEKSERSELVGKVLTVSNEGTEGRGK